MPTSFRPISLRSLLPFLIVHCLLGLHCQLVQDGVHDDLWIGKNLSSEEAVSLEEKLADDPKDVISRTRLLGYYWERLAHDDGSALAARRGHVLWLVRNTPEAEVLGHPEGTIDSTADPEGYSEGRKAWTNQVDTNPENVTILGHAAHFLWSEDGETATELLQRARSLDPSNAEWSEDLARRYARKMYRGSQEATREAAEKALKLYEIAFELSDERDRETLLEDLAKVAFEAGRHDKARQYAESMLQDAQAGMTWNYGNRVHHGNLVLGRIALAEGNVKAAKISSDCRRKHTGVTSTQFLRPKYDARQGFPRAG